MRKIIIVCLIAAGIILVCLGVYIGIRIWQENQITFTIEDTLPDGKGQKATVILLGGQSNASGCSLDEYLRKNVPAEKYAEYENGYDNVYINYISGSHVSNGFVKCATLQGELDGAFGPELGLAEKLHELYPDRLFFIIKCAWGGTNLFEQWLSPSSCGWTGELYQKFVAFAQANMQYLADKNYDAVIEGMCWMQGESDSFSVEHATGYEQHLSNFIKDIRDKLSQYASSDGIAFVDAFIADNPVYWVYCDDVNQSKVAVAEKSHMNVVIDTLSIGLSCDREPEGNPDMAHYDSLSELKLGHLFAEEIAKFIE
ncbi:MAG: sialate O-acetylesterase [Ruminococcaceae bacterium]|nr:sialate O-acetylesterase [Oscillospiraceae bacterium]